MVECSHGKRETLGSSLGRATFFFRPCDIWWPVWGRARAASSNLKETVSSDPAWFRADSGTNLIKQGGVTGRSCRLVVESSHGKRETLGSSPGRATFFFRPCDIWWLCVGPCSGCEQQPERDCLVGSGMVPSRFGDKSN